MSITFTIPGPPKGKGRHRTDFKRKRQYPEPATVLYELRVIDAWRNAGSGWLDGPLAMRVEMVLTRPGGHYRVNGELSKAGLASAAPLRKPDWDNTGKIISDSLNGHAYKDDAQIVDGHVVKRWANPGERDHVAVRIYTPAWTQVAA
jgi:Holliday junction resolvase RusA-like endonuclease